MSIVTLALFKKHVRADDFADDDDYLQTTLDAAEAFVIRATNRTEDELIEMGGGTFPIMLQRAILLIGAAWYDQREGLSSVQMNIVPTTQALIRPFRKLVNDSYE